MFKSVANKNGVYRWKKLYEMENPYESQIYLNEIRAAGGDISFKQNSRGSFSPASKKKKCPAGKQKVGGKCLVKCKVGQVRSRDTNRCRKAGMSPKRSRSRSPKRSHSRSPKRRRRSRSRSPKRRRRSRSRSPKRR